MWKSGIKMWFTIKCWIFFLMRTCVPKVLVIIGLINIICGVPTTLVFATSGPNSYSNSLLLRIHLIHNPNLLQSNYYSSFDNIHVERNNHFHFCGCYDCIKWLSNLYSNKLSPCFNNYHFWTLGEVVLTRVWQCSILWLLIGIFYGAKYGCEYISNFLLLNWMDGWICQLYNPNWLPNSMPLNMI